MWGATNYITCRMLSAKSSSIAGGAYLQSPKVNQKNLWVLMSSGANSPCVLVPIRSDWHMVQQSSALLLKVMHLKSSKWSAAQSDLLLLKVICCCSSAKFELMHYLQPSDEDFWQFLLSRLWAFNRQQFWLTLRFCSRCDSAIGPSVIWHSCASWDILDKAFLWPGKSFSFWFVAWSYFCVRCNVATLWLLWGTLFSPL